MRLRRYFARFASRPQMREEYAVHYRDWDGTRKCGASSGLATVFGPNVTCSACRASLTTEERT